MEFKDMLLSGCYEIQPHSFKDIRGKFVKTFHQALFAERGLRTDFVEQYYSVSKYRVLRGLHFQVPVYHRYNEKPHY